MRLLAVLRNDALAPQSDADYAHDRMCGTPAAARMLDRVLQHIRGKEGVWFARKDEIARWATAQPPPAARP
jgi:peptidoglycan/xylan/chitin deacetylase (PgdA/CDA1 family)